MKAMRFNVPVRITRTRRCKEGFYLLANGQRLHFKRHCDAVGALLDLLGMQRFQVISVRDYTRSRLNKSTPMRHRSTFCPNCRADLNASHCPTPTRDKADPQRGDISVCYYCGLVFRFDDELCLVKLSKEEFTALDNDTRREVLRLILASKYVSDRLRI